MEKFTNVMHSIFCVISFLLLFIGFYTCIAYFKREMNIFYIGIVMLGLGLIGLVIEGVYIFLKMKKNK